MRAFGNQAFLGRRYQSGDTDPTVTFTGGAAGADTLARMAAFRRAELTPVTGVDLLNASAQDIDSPALTVPADDLAIIESTWKQDDYSANSARSGFTPIGGVSATAGDDAAFSWWYQIQTDATDLATATHTITGGGAAISRASIIALEHAAYLNEQTDDITPTITEPWLKSVARPFLNQPVTFGGDTFAMERPARRGVFDVVGRSLPVAVSDVRSSRRYSLILRTETDSDATDLDLLFASGDVLYLQHDGDCVVPSGVYLSVGDTIEAFPSPPDELRFWSVPVVEVAPPGPDVVGAAATYQTLLSTYATYADVLAAHATYASILELIGDPTEVIVA
jgi:hypothetical protein